MSSIENAQQILQAGGESGNVFDHITGLVLKILQEQPDNALAAFESLSLQVKEGKVSEVESANNASNATAQVEWAGKVLSSVSSGEPESVDGVQNLHADALLLEWAGISFTQDELFVLQKQMRDIVNQETEGEDPISKIRFWGKFLGCRGADYYVFECVCGSDVEVPENVQMEGREGVNKFMYWVSCQGKMSKLPHVTEQQLIIARQTRKFLTGDLGVPVSGYPPFPGKEAHYLRALIALIGSETSVAPASFFGLSEDDENPSVVSKMEATEEDGGSPEGLSAETCGDLGSWTHFEMCIDSKGRMTAVPEVEGEDGEMTPDPRYADATKNREDPLGALGDEEDAWKSCVCPSAGRGPESVGVIKSARWPGAVAVAPVGQIRFVNCYVGYGIDSMGSTYTPPVLPSLQAEYAGAISEQADVTEAPVEPVEEVEDE